jgi:hypothetical protein
VAGGDSGVGAGAGGGGAALATGGGAAGGGSSPPHATRAMADETAATARGTNAFCMLRGSHEKARESKRPARRLTGA